MRISKKTGSVVVVLFAAGIAGIQIWPEASESTAGRAHPEERSQDSPSLSSPQFAARQIGVRRSTDSGVPAEKVAFSAELRETLLDIAKRPAQRVPLRQGEREQRKATMRLLAGNVINFDEAKQRKSGKFKRTSFMHEGKDRPLFLSDRLGDKGQLLGERPMAANAEADSVKTIYRESDDGSSFKLQRLKERASYSGSTLPNGEVQKSGRDFLLESGLIKEAGNDKIQGTEIRERRTNGEDGEGATADNLEQQDILLRREFEGKPVINSVASVGVLPEDGEVVLLKVSNWDSADGGAAQTFKPHYDEQQANILADAWQNKVVQVLQEDGNNALEGATVRGTTEAWFQDEDGLSPALVFNVEITPKGGGEVREIPVVVNPYGSEDEIWYQGRPPRQEAAPPLDQGSVPVPPESFGDDEPAASGQ
jgi:hypothetical protein